MKGVDIGTLMRLLGHKSVIKTLRYSQLNDKHRINAVELLVDGEGGHPMSMTRT